MSFYQNYLKYLQFTLTAENYLSFILCSMLTLCLFLKQYICYTYIHHFQSTDVTKPCCHSKLRCHIFFFLQSNGIQMQYIFILALMSEVGHNEMGFFFIEMGKNVS